MKESTIVLDLDGTLVDTAPDLANALNAVLARAGVAPLTLAEVRPIAALGARYMVEEGLRRAGAAADVEALLKQFLRHYDLHIADASRPFPGAVEALETLKGAGATLAVCTTKREHFARKLLQTLDLDKYFSGLAGGDTFPHRKPHPAHLTGTIDLAGGDPARAVMVGDTEFDVFTARAAEIPVIGVSFGYAAKPIASYAPDTIIDSFAELPVAAQRLLAAPAKA
jgi:phosphoglycolate phosphatase